MKIYCIFGATGNLSQSKILPALFDIFKTGDDFSILCFGRKEMSSQDFRDLTFHSQNIYSQTFLEKIVYLKVDPNIKDDFSKIEENLKSTYSQIFFYLSLPPSEYLNIIKSLCSLDIKKTFHILVEKPFADSLDSLLEIKQISEKSKFAKILFVDHYLFKKLIDDILDYKVNLGFESFLDSLVSVEVKFLESNTLAKRGGFYDKTGAVFDVFQNHILQMINAVFSSNPKNFNSDNRVDILKKINLLSSGFARGQYVGFRQEDGVLTSSQTETYFKAGLVFSHQEKHIPVLVEAGKSCQGVFVGVIFNFKDGSNFQISSSSENSYIKMLKMEDFSRFVSFDEASLSFKIANDVKKAISKEELLFYNMEDGLC